MENRVVGQHLRARYLLYAGYDTVGSNPTNSDEVEFRNKTRVNPKHSWHYSGNFWWATAKHISSIGSLTEKLNFSVINHVDRINKAETYSEQSSKHVCRHFIFFKGNAHVRSQSGTNRGFHKYRKPGQTGRNVKTIRLSWGMTQAEGPPRTCTSRLKPEKPHELCDLRDWKKKMVDELGFRPFDFHIIWMSPDLDSFRMQDI